MAAALPVVLTDDANTYVYGLDLISSTDNATATQTYFLYDGLGSTVNLTNTSGNSTQAYSYDVFGATQGGPPPGANQWLFTGEQRDAETGQQLETLNGNIYHYGARLYNADPSTPPAAGSGQAWGGSSAPTRLCRSRGTRRR